MEIESHQSNEVSSNGLSSQTRKWFVFQGNRHIGPFSSTEIEARVMGSILDPQSFIWSEGMADWAQLRDVETFKKVAASAPPFSEDAVTDSYADANLDNENVWASIPEVEKIPTVEVKSVNDIAREQREKATDIQLREILSRLQQFPFTADFIDPLSGQATNKPAAWPHVVEEETAVAVETAVAKQRKKTRTMNYVASAAIAAGMIALAVVFIIQQRSVFSTVKGVSRDEINELRAAASTFTGSSVAVAMSAVDLAVPSFYIGSNLPRDTRLKVMVEGIPDTLVGQFQADVVAGVSIHDGLAHTAPIRQENGKALPKGDYKVEVTCVDCPNPRAVLVSKTYFIGGAKDSEYASLLKTYHSQLTEQIDGEVIEIRQIADTLENQLQMTGDKFDSIGHLKTGIDARRRAWAEFDTQWLDLEHQLTAMFTAWTPDAFKAQFYYGNLYQQLKETGNAVDQIHADQSNYVTDGTQDAEEKSRILNATAKAQGMIENVRNKITSIQRAPSDTGVPKREESQ